MGKTHKPAIMYRRPACDAFAISRCLGLIICLRYIFTRLVLALWWTGIIYCILWSFVNYQEDFNLSEVMESDLIYTLFVSACLLLALADGCVGSG